MPLRRAWRASTPGRQSSACSWPTRMPACGRIERWEDAAPRKRLLRRSPARLLRGRSRAASPSRMSLGAWKVRPILPGQSHSVQPIESDVARLTVPSSTRLNPDTRLQKGGLPRTVRSHQPVNLPRMHGQAHVVDGQHPSEPPGNISDYQIRMGAGVGISLRSRPLSAPSASPSCTHARRPRPRRPIRIVLGGELVSCW